MLRDHFLMYLSGLNNQSNLLESSTESHQAGPAAVQDDHYYEPTKLLPETFLQKDVEVERWLLAWEENQYGDGYCDDPSVGPLMNSVLNAADHLIIPVDSGFFALHGIKSLLAELEEIKLGTNPNLEILGFLLTFADGTNISQDVLGALKNDFGTQVFRTAIRRSVKLKEAPTFGRTIFHHAPQSTGASDYLMLADKILKRLGIAHSVRNSRAAIAAHMTVVGDAS